jgi:NAD(P)-dependent dehydrogenase (short-subunit alcohol dehydrogenase family)
MNARAGEKRMAVITGASKHFGRIDLLVNNTGICIPRPFTEYTPEDFETMIATNVAGYFFVTQPAVARKNKFPALVRKSNSGKV